MEWLGQRWEADNGQYWRVIERKMAMVAAQGSVQHAEQYCKMRSGTYAQKGAESDPGPSSGFSVNVLVPCPRVPNGGSLPARVRRRVPRLRRGDRPPRFATFP
jgi:hypothetical protein